MPTKNLTPRPYSANLIAPDRSSERYNVEALNKAEARKKIRAFYYSDVPRMAKLHGFFSFEDHRLVWVEQED